MNNNIKMYNLILSLRNNNTPMIDKYETNDDLEKDINFCKLFYGTSDLETIDKLILLTGIDNLSKLNKNLPQNFSVNNYYKFCSNINNEILIKKHYIDITNKKMNTEQLLNIIIIRNTNNPIDEIFTEINNLNITISLITNMVETIDHYNIKKYNYINIEDTLNYVIENNTSKYYMIIYDNYKFNKNFMSDITKELDNIYNTNCLILLNDNKQKNNSIEYFYININDIINIDEYICIFSNNIKKKYEYSVSDIGLFLYTNQLLNKYNKILTTTYYDFEILKKNNLLNEMKTLFNIYTKNIENDKLSDPLPEFNKFINL